MSGRPLDALLVEDSEDDALLLVRELGQQGFDVTWERVQTGPAMKDALARRDWAVVLSDFKMPAFDAPAALRVLQDSGQDLPFIVISGTIGENTAVEMMKAGAHDYLLKGSLTRLGQAIERELRESQVRRERRAGIEKIEHVSRVLRAIRDVNQLIVREKDPVRLIEECCECLVATGVYDAAWIALLDEQHEANTVACRGFGHAGDDLAEGLEHGKLPFCAAEALSSPTVVVIDEELGGCRDCVIRRHVGCQKTLTVRIEHQERVYGVMAVTLLGSVTIDESESSLFEEVAGDIGFALWSTETERKRLAEEERFRVTFENANIGKALTAPDGRLVRVNQAFCDLLGYSRAEMEAKDFVSITHPDDHAISREVVRSLLAGERASGRIEKRYLHKDGRPVWSDVSTILMHKQDGSPDAFITHVLDISERKKLEGELRSSEEKFRNVFQRVTEGLLLADAATQRFVMVNEVCCEMLGYTERELLDLSVRDIHPPKDLPAVAATYEAQRSGKMRLAPELPMVRKDGAVFRADVSAAAVRIDDHEYLLGCFRDVTERKRLQASVAQADRLASMGMLAAGVAHEINNPLCYVLYNLESLTDDLPRVAAAMQQCLDLVVPLVGEEQWAAAMGQHLELFNPAMLDEFRVRFRDALQGTERIKEIARGLGSFSRVEQDRPVPVNLRNVIEVASNLVFNEIKYRCRLVKEYGKISSILANDGKLSQVFLNLLVNAAHSIEDGDVDGNEIRVRTWQEGDEVVAEVRDTGKGIAAEHLSNLFEPFFTTKEIGVGTGLGLSISKSIVEGYGGTIDVKSEVGEGTSFVVRLPIQLAQDSDEAGLPEHTDIRRFARGRILVVDDEAPIRSIMTQMLRGHDVVEAASGHEACKILEADRAFDLILCDMMMPRMSGVELHEWLLTTEPELARKVVFVTGGAFTPRARSYLDKVSNIRLEKPFDVANFKKIVGELIVAGRAK